MLNIKTEKIEKIELKIQQLQNEKKRLINQYKEYERKTRTRRLIQRGAILESVLVNLNELNNEQIKRFLEKTIVTSYADQKFKEVKSWNPDVVDNKSVALE